MRLADFDFELPPGLIAQTPAAQRDEARLLVLERATGAVRHRRVADLVELLCPGDLLVLNDTRVLSARLAGRKSTGGRVELLLVERPDPAGAPRTWRALLRSSREPAEGAQIVLEEGLSARLLERAGQAWIVELSAPDGQVDERLERVGRLPLPPYIRRPEGGASADDRERYQTVYARHPGAVAAPTAGLHFTTGLLAELARRIELAYVTLHVGPGTFQPVRAERIDEHVLQPEPYELPRTTAQAIERTRERGGRVVAVGTTVVRTLETRAAGAGRVHPGAGRSGLFIRPGFAFAVVDVLLTNFHLPRSTLLMLVAAFAGRERVLSAYDVAIREGYRFYSYGDAMLVV